MKMNRKFLTIIVAILFAVTACFTACMTTTKQAGVSSVVLVPFWGPDQNINNRCEKEVYTAVKKMRGYSPVQVNTADLLIPYESPDPSLIGDYKNALTGELRRDPDDPDFWHLTLYLWRGNRLIFSDTMGFDSPNELVDQLPMMLEWLFSWMPRGETNPKEASARNATVSSVALVPFWGSEQNIINQFGTELYTAVGNMKDFQPVRIDMTNLPKDVPEGGFPPFICPSPSLIKTNPLALTGEVTRTDTGSLSLRLYLWEMADTRLVYTSKLTARNMSEYRLLLPELLKKLFSQI